MTDHTPLTEQQLDQLDTLLNGPLGDASVVDAGTGRALVAEIRRLHAFEAAAVTVRAKHKRRTERHGSGCVQCGIVWPCPTYLGLDAAGERHVAEAGR